LPIKHLCATGSQRFGPSPRAFIVLPLVSAFFIDLLNAVLIAYFLHHL
jgi:glutamate:Na+ symporter, ESS family